MGWELVVCWFQIFAGKLFMKFRADAIVITDQRVCSLFTFLPSVDVKHGKNCFDLDNS